MYSFLNDYNEICHERILNSIIKNNMEQTLGYGEDKFCHTAKNLIRERFGLSDETEVWFFIGGTAANLNTLSYILRPYEAVLSVDTGHINCHEGGAIEATGHKVLVSKNINGKLDLEASQKIVDEHFQDNHMVLPKAIYLSNATEMGTVYTLQELKDIKAFAEKNNMYLFLDGARLGTGLTSKYSDIKPEDLAKYTDLFYIGGTKNGAPIGEALVINNQEIKYDIVRHMKQKGAVLAKGKILGISYIELFKDDLYFDLARHANLMAEKISTSLDGLNIKFTERVESNQIFMEFTMDEVKEIQKEYDFSIQKKLDDDKYMTRFVTSWATDEKEVDKFIEFMKNLKLN